MKNMCNCAGKRCGNHHLGMFLLRLATGAVFIYHGWMKFQNITGTQAYFASLHLWPWLATFVAVLEIVGGAALILGLWTCFFAPLLAMDMIVVIILAKWGMGWGKMELEVMLLASTFAIKHSGRGKWGMGKHCGCIDCMGKAHVCQMCGHDQRAGEGCDCVCHK